MPIINITVKVRASFVEEAHRKAIVETAREGAKQVLTNIIMLTPSNNRIQPSVTMAVVEGKEETEIDIAQEMATLAPEYEDPFA